MTIPSTIRGGLIVVVVLCSLCKELTAQVSPYPYLSAPQRERGVREFVDAGMVRRAAAELDALFRESRLSAISDVSRFDRSDVLRRSGNRAASDREMDRFLRDRSNSPYVPLAWMERALAAVEDNDPKVAAELFSRCASESRIAIQQRGDTFYVHLAHSALFWEGATRAGMGQHKEALDVFAACISIDTSGQYAAYSYYAMGQIFERNSDLPQSITSFDIVRTKYPESALTVASRIRESVDLIALRKPERALDVLTGIETSLVLPIDDQRTAQIDTEHAEEEIALVRAQAYSLRGRYSEALDSCTSFFQRYPGSTYRWLLHLQAGFAALNLGRPDTARFHYEVIIDSVVDESSTVRQQAQLYHALCLKRLGREQDAMREFSALGSIVGYPYKAQALIEVGQMEYESGDFDKSRKSLERAERESRDAPTSIRAHTLLGATLIELQQWDKAAQAYERAQRIAEEAADEFLPDRQIYLSEIRLKRGICLVQSGQTQPAINALTDFLGNHPNDIHRDEATFWLAESMYRADLLKNAQELYEEVVKRYTASTRREESMYGLAWTYFRRRDFDRSTSMFGELLKTYPSSRYAAEALARRGDGLYISRQFRAAAEQYRLAAEKGPTTEEGQYSAFQSGQASYRAGDLDAAVTHMRRFVQKYPKNRLADDALYLVGWIAFPMVIKLCALFIPLETHNTTSVRSKPRYQHIGA
ncbi:MAG: tetratricopeptide repeat protein [Candidatus Kapabacteria bacterium]|nr:tetratricopeptide repeat protein [Candidatus Kapabacteria bacterium]